MESKPMIPRWQNQVRSIKTLSKYITRHGKLETIGLESKLSCRVHVMDVIKHHLDDALVCSINIVPLDYISYEEAEKQGLKAALIEEKCQAGFDVPCLRDPVCLVQPIIPRHLHAEWQARMMKKFQDMMNKEGQES